MSSEAVESLFRAWLTRKGDALALLLYGGVMVVSAIVASQQSGGSLRKELLFLLVIGGVVLLARILLPQVKPRSLSIVAPRKEALFACTYLVLWFIFAWNFGGLVNDVTHWLTLVALPVGFLYILRRRQGAEGRFRQTLRSIGITRENLGASLKLALLVGLISAPVVVWGSAKQRELWEIIVSGRVVYLFPLAFILMLLFPGFTEEVFFRGILQSRLAAVLGSELRGLLLATFLFSLYHLPYAYHLEGWPSYGNLPWAVSQVFIEGLAGLLIGILWLRTRSLFAGVFLHSFLNAFVGMTMINFSIRFKG
jgi:membrane protease YdiL (CAAX protease family)